MYLKRLTLQNIKCFENTTVDFVPEGGWNVLLGVNGTGKTTLLQAMALAMLGPVSGGRLLQLPATWVRRGADYGTIEAELQTTGDSDNVSLGKPRKKPYETRLFVSGEKPVKPNGLELVQPQVAVDTKLSKSLNAGPYSGRAGWFSAGYGPFRRLSGGGGEENASILYAGGREARHLTLFRESAALTNCEKWLTQLHSEAVDSALPADAREVAGRKRDVAKLVIDKLLPTGVHIGGMSSLGVTFRARNGAEVALGQLSDGFRSFLALVIDLLRHVFETVGEAAIYNLNGDWILADFKGVVLIDEADAHLHPSWQRDIGFRLTEVFPFVQFIVSTHSPFVAQAARDRGLFVVRGNEEGDVVVEPADVSVRGWRADQVLLSPLFNLTSTRDPETESLLDERSRLLGVAERGSEQSSRLAELDEVLRDRLTAPGDTLVDRDRERQMQALIDERLAYHRNHP
ncbi:MAG: AAA family ATPase [Myxococcales bacterium]|nr:AAA family ATPase [Myxococcales bacterium]